MFLVLPRLFSCFLVEGHAFVIVILDSLRYVLVMKSFFAPASVLACGMAGAGSFIGKGIADRHSGQRLISVKGLAECSVPATLAIWNIGYQCSANDLAKLNEKLKNDTQSVSDFWIKKHGFTESEIAVQPPSVTDKSWIERDAPAPAVRDVGYQSILLRSASESFSKDSQASFRKLRNASQGWFHVEDRDEVTPEQKVVRVVVKVQCEVE